MPAFLRLNECCYFFIHLLDIFNPTSKATIPPNMSTKTCCFIKRVEANTPSVITIVADRYKCVYILFLKLILNAARIQHQLSKQCMEGNKFTGASTV